MPILHTILRELHQVKVLHKSVLALHIFQLDFHVETEYLGFTLTTPSSKGTKDPDCANGLQQPRLKNNEKSRSQQGK